MRAYAVCDLISIDLTARISDRFWIQHMGLDIIPILQTPMLLISLKFPDPA